MCAVAAERDAVLAGAPSARVVVSGVGPAAAAAATATALASGPRPAGVVSAGIAGSYAGLPAGSVVLADRMVAADLGVAAPQAFLDLATLGFGVSSYTPDATATAEAARRCGAVTGTVLTLSAATGTADRARELQARHDPVAEAMEGTGVSTAAAAAGLPVLELRTISNPVGDRDLSRWDLPTAFAALTAASAAALTQELPWTR